jgi:hypothetical protein
MSNAGPQILNTLVCDDVRLENNGKEILIGVYNGTVIIDNVPALLPTFSIRILVKPTEIREYNINGAITGPSGLAAAQFSGKFNVLTTKLLATFSLRISPLVINELGEYHMKIGIDAPIEEVYTFNVITKEQMSA